MIPQKPSTTQRITLCLFAGLLGCSNPQQLPPSTCSPFTSADGPLSLVEDPAPLAVDDSWLSVDYDVLIAGQVPVVNLWANGFVALGQYSSTTQFDVFDSTNALVPRACGQSKQNSSSQGSVGLSFECYPFSHPGVFTIRIYPSALKLEGAPAIARIRVLEQSPQPVAAPVGWAVKQLTNGLPDWYCYGNAESYSVTLSSEAYTITKASLRPPAAKLPVPLTSRMSSEHAARISHVFAARDGWLVMFDAGEFGGGIEWYTRDARPPRTVQIGREIEGEGVSQNVIRAEVANEHLYVLQGLGHMGTNDGQLAVLWREHDHFSYRILARFSSTPFDWLSDGNGAWIVGTRHAIWRVDSKGDSELVARLPSVLNYPNSLIRTPDGSFLIGTRGGVLRLTPAWHEEPKYQAEFLLPEGSPQAKCWIPSVDGNSDQSSED